MRILVVSDTHGNESALIRSYGMAGETDLLIHLGDGEKDTDLLLPVYEDNIIKVSGNCDIGSTAQRELLLELDGKRVLITHGDRYYVKSGLERLFQHGRTVSADIVLYGHTHMARADIDGNMLVLNPGALCLHTDIRTFAIITIHNGSIEFMHHNLD